MGLPVQTSKDPSKGPTRTLKVFDRIVSDITSIFEYLGWVQKDSELQWNELKKLQAEVGAGNSSGTVTAIVITNGVKTIVTLDGQVVGPANP